jgi:hypothetical protein
VDKNINVNSIIDYVVIKQQGTAQKEDVWVFRGENSGSDHFLMRSKIFLPWIYSTDSSMDVNQKVRATYKRGRKIQC